MTFSVCREVMSTTLIYFCGEILILHVDILMHEVQTAGDTLQRSREVQAFCGSGVLATHEKNVLLGSVQVPVRKWVFSYGKIQVVES